MNGDLSWKDAMTWSPVRDIVPLRDIPRDTMPQQIRDGALSRWDIGDVVPMSGTCFAWVVWEEDESGATVLDSGTSPWDPRPWDTADG